MIKNVCQLCQCPFDDMSKERYLELGNYCFDCTDIISMRVEGKISGKKVTAYILRKYDYYKSGRLVDDKIKSNLLVEVGYTRASQRRGKPFITIEEWKKIIDYICFKYSVTFSQIVREGRRRSYIFMKEILIFLLKERYNLSYTNIAVLMGRRDHTTIMHHYKKILPKRAYFLELIADIP